MKKVLSVGAAIAVSGTLAYSAEAASHTVDKGDTLSEIAHENNSTVEAIKSENNLSSNLILPGQVLQVNNEENTEAPAEDGVYKIQSGDTLFEIAQKFDVTVSDLKAWNNLSSDLIFAGKTLAVSGNSVEQAPVVETPQVEETPEVQETQEVERTQQVNQAPAQPSEQDQAAEQRAAEQAAAEQRAAEQAAAEQRAAEERAAEQAAQEREQRNQAQAQNQSTSTSSNASGQNWGALAQCESSGNASVVSSNGLYHGLYQFDVQTWQSVGGSGLPSQASAAEQTKRAQILFDQRGAQPWPVCGSRL
ncbi:LysM peptidoglycan-binding domain-containing protein [Salinicoccus bachuensis]|uniref:LysM peptidoglycan-binding domain-containing protein n=1 Tax=Salinicoccus bachuensis TaxID=3136731 RepID=A0ABZ3CGC2_9STAP